MNKSESKYFKTAARMDEAFLELLDEKDFPYITVKEICQRAGVNRSTFYLHYETIGDLLTESLEHMNEEFLSYFKNSDTDFVEHVRDASEQNLNTVRPEYLLPYLAYIKDYKKLFRTALKQKVTLQTRDTYEQLFKNVFTPVFDRLGVPARDREYLVTFHIHGLMAIVQTWLEGDCVDDIEHIAELMQTCVKSSSSTE